VNVSGKSEWLTLQALFAAPNTNRLLTNKGLFDTQGPWRRIFHGKRPVNLFPPNSVYLTPG
jgi:hypothetical protein